jgi:hypothetical protein
MVLGSVAEREAVCAEYRQISGRGIIPKPGASALSTTPAGWSVYKRTKASCRSIKMPAESMRPEAKCPSE